jgi:mRNA-degrading endonuclease RelE of RelBE toxin-antitoxin system
VAKYAIDIKPSARKELENLSDSLIARLIPKMYTADDDRKMVSVTRVAHRPSPSSSILA